MKVELGESQKSNFIIYFLTFRNPGTRKASQMDAVQRAWQDLEAASSIPIDPWVELRLTMSRLLSRAEPGLEQISVPMFQDPSLSTLSNPILLLQKVKWNLFERENFEIWTIEHFNRLNIWNTKMIPLWGIHKWRHTSSGCGFAC